jgi:hypothetical protein
MNSNAHLQLIAELNLDPIKAKLMHKESGEGWTLGQANAVEVEYRRFLTLMKLFPNEQISPRFDVDIFWHYHILDTMKYAIDCQNIFGYFVHHFPYIGMSGEEEAEDATAQQAAERMQALYESSFGAPYMPRPTLDAGLVGTSYCANAAQNDSVYYARPVLEAHVLSTLKAYCANAAQNDGVTTNGATANKARSYCANAPQKMAYCANAPQEVAYCANAPQEVAYCANAPQKVTYCANAPQKVSYCANAPQASAYCANVVQATTYCANAPQSAYCANAPQTSSAYLKRPELAIAA